MTTGIAIHTRHRCAHGASVLLLASLFQMCLAQPHADAGTFMGKNLYWQQSGFPPDTVGWRTIEFSLVGADTTDCNTPASARERLAQHNLRCFKLKNASALSAAILAAARFTVVTFGQWAFAPRTAVRIGTRGDPDRYDKQRVTTGYLFESVRDVELQKPARLGGDFVVRLGFAGGGFSDYEGRQVLSQSAAAIQSNSEEYTISFEGTLHSEAPVGKREVLAVYVIAPAENTAKKLISAIESEMDSMKLDMTYKPPDIVELK